jgi:hypothetical protein
VVGAGVANAAVAGDYAFQADFATNFTASDDGSVQTWALMANAWFDLKNDTEFTPYIGGGVGYAISKFQGGAVYDGVDGNFAWQMGVGVNVCGLGRDIARRWLPVLRCGRRGSHDADAVGIDNHIRAGRPRQRARAAAHAQAELVGDWGDIT